MKKIDMNRKMSREDLTAYMESIYHGFRAVLDDEKASESAKEEMRGILLPGVKAGRDLTYTAIQRWVNMYNNLIHSQVVDENKLAGLVGRIKEAEKAVQTADLYAALDRYAEMSYNDACEAYIATQKVKTISFTFDKESGVCSEAEKGRDEYLAPYDFFRTVLADAELPQLLDGVKILRENFACYNLLNSEDDKAEEALLDRKPLSKAAEALRKKMKWEKYSTKAALKSQLLTCWKWMLGKAAPKTANSMDVNFVLQGIVDTVDKADSVGGFKEKGAPSITNLIFRAAYTNSLKKPYKMHHADDRNAELESVKANREMAESKDKPDPKTEVTGAEVKAAKPAAKKPAAKKSEPKPETKAEESQPKK